MNKFFKKVRLTDGIGIILLAILVVVAGYMVYFQKDFKVTTKTKSEHNNQKLAGYYYNGKYYYYDDYYDNYDNDDYYYDDDDYDDDYYYNDDYYYDDDYYYNDDYYYDDDYYYNDDYYNGRYMNNNYNDYYDYNDKTKPTFKYKSSRVLIQYENYDPMEDVSASHSKFGDLTDEIEIVYDNVDTDVPGTYVTIYKVCNYPGSIYCITASRDVTVKEEGYDVNDSDYNYSRGPVWDGTDTVTCTQGSSKCSTRNISKPTATDPVTERNLSVKLIDGYVDVDVPGTYALVYSSETKWGVVGTTTKFVRITEKYNSSSNSSSNKASRKYISNYRSEYYDDGYYRGYLEADYDNTISSKFINDFSWTNKVTYTYKCVNQGQHGLSGWSLVSTDKSNGQVTSNVDNHPTYYYNKDGYSGTLNKIAFYLNESEDKLANDLGYCNTVGQTKQVNRTWVGLYSGYVYSNNNNYKNTYSGYVYLYR